MLIAACLDVADNDSPSMTAARQRFASWASKEPALDVAADLLDLPNWTLTATADQKNAALTALSKIGKDDPLAVTVLAWLLLPAATRLTCTLFDADPSINEIVASNLWSAAATHDHTRPVNVASSIIRRTRNGVFAEVGIGDRTPERRRDRAWANAVVIGPDARLWERLAGTTLEDLAAVEELDDLLDAAEAAGVISALDRDVLWSAACEADRQAASGACTTRTARGHGRNAGLTAPTVAAAVGAPRGMRGTAVRSRVSRRLRALGEYAKTSSPTVRTKASSEALRS